MTSLQDVRFVVVPHALALEANTFLARVGRRGMEALALWSGTQSGSTFNVGHTLIPQQRAVRSQSGVCVIVDSHELHNLNMWLYQNNQSVIAQIHSHPADAYHSDTDDHFAIATEAGSLSIVVPDFARHPFSLSDCAVCRLSDSGRWLKLSCLEASNLIAITG